MRNRQFVGCMRNLSIDGRHVDMASFIANNGTRAGAVGASWGRRGRARRASSTSWGTELLDPAARGPGVPPLWRACRRPERMIPGPQVAHASRHGRSTVSRVSGPDGPGAPGLPAASPTVPTGCVSLPHGLVLGDMSRPHPPTP